jgi:alpha-tubulin suppressor-like RCC1 family protein
MGLQVQQMAFGYRHCVLLSQEGRVYVMGDNSRHQLG